MANRRTTTLWTIDKEGLRNVLQGSSSIQQALSNLKVPVAGGNYATLRRRSKQEGLEADFEALRLRGLREGIRQTTDARKTDFASILVSNSSYLNRGRLKIRLISAGLLKNKCAKCGSPPEWQGNPLVLVLDHINGVNNDNRLENLRLLCPNCNSQTATFAGRNRKLGNSSTGRAAGSDSVG